MDSDSRVINFWTASKEEFQTLEGIGQKLADRLISLRKHLCNNKNEVTSEDLANVALKESVWNEYIDRGILSIRKPNNPAGQSIQPCNADISQLQAQVNDLSLDNDLLNRKFQELDARIEIRFSQVDSHFDLLAQKLNTLLERTNVLSSHETPPKYTRQSEFEQPTQHLRFDTKSTDDKFPYPTITPPNVSPSCAVESPNFRSQQPTLTTQQQQEEIDHMLAVIYSCCPENDRYNGSSRTRTTHNNLTTLTTNMRTTPPLDKPDKYNKRDLDNETTETSSSSSSCSSSNSPDMTRHSRKNKKRKNRSKSPVMPKMPEFSGKYNRISWRSFIGKYRNYDLDDSGRGRSRFKYNHWDQRSNLRSNLSSSPGYTYDEQDGCDYRHDYGYRQRSPNRQWSPYNDGQRSLYNDRQRSPYNGRSYNRSPQQYRRPMTLARFLD